MNDERKFCFTPSGLLAAFVAMTLLQGVGTLIAISRTYDLKPRVETNERDIERLRKYADRRVDYLRRYTDQHLTQASAHGQ